MSSTSSAAPKEGMPPKAASIFRRRPSDPSVAQEADGNSTGSQQSFAQSSFHSPLQRSSSPIAITEIQTGAILPPPVGPAEQDLLLESEHDIELEEKAIERTNKAIDNCEDKINRAEKWKQDYEREKDIISDKQLIPSAKRQHDLEIASAKDSCDSKIASANETLKQYYIAVPTNKASSGESNKILQDTMAYIARARQEYETECANLKASYKSRIDSITTNRESQIAQVEDWKFKVDIRQNEERMKLEFLRKKKVSHDNLRAGYVKEAKEIKKLFAKRPVLQIDLSQSKDSPLEINEAERPQFALTSRQGGVQQVGIVIESDDSFSDAESESPTKTNVTPQDLHALFRKKNDPVPTTTSNKENGLSLQEIDHDGKSMNAFKSSSSVSAAQGRIASSTDQVLGLPCHDYNTVASVAATQEPSQGHSSAPQRSEEALVATDQGHAQPPASEASKQMYWCCPKCFTKQEVPEEFVPHLQVKVLDGSTIVDIDAVVSQSIKPILTRGRNGTAAPKKYRSCSAFNNFKKHLKSCYGDEALFPLHFQPVNKRREIKDDDGNDIADGVEDLPV